MKQINWNKVEEILKSTVGARLTPLGAGRATVLFDNKPVAILWDLTEANSDPMLGCSLRASLTPNQASLMVSALAINMFVLMDEPWEFGADGERLQGEMALEYVFGQFYDKKCQEKFNQIDHVTPRILN